MPCSPGTLAPVAACMSVLCKQVLSVGKKSSRKVKKIKVKGSRLRTLPSLPPSQTHTHQYTHRRHCNPIHCLHVTISIQSFTTIQGYMNTLIKHTFWCASGFLRILFSLRHIYAKSTVWRGLINVCSNSCCNNQEDCFLSRSFCNHSSYSPQAPTVFQFSHSKFRINGIIQSIILYLTSKTQCKVFKNQRPMLFHELFTPSC